MGRKRTKKGRTEDMDRYRYADLVRRVVVWVEERQSQGVVTDYGNIAYRFSLTHDEIDAICGDSEVYGPTLMPHALRVRVRRGATTVEVLSAVAPDDAGDVTCPS